MWVQKAEMYMHNRSCNIASWATCWGDFPICGAVEAMQELHEVPEQVMHMIHTCVARMPE